MLLSWCPGQQMAEALISRPTQVWKLGRAFGKMQARLNAIAVPADLATECFDWIDWVGREEQALQTRLRAEVGRRGLLHFDYHPQNVLVADGQVSAVIDWSNATVGDPRADVARTYTILSVEPWPPTLPWYIRLGRRILSAARAVLDYIAAGKLKVTLKHTYALADAAAAHQTIEAHQTKGKVVLTV